MCMNSSALDLLVHMDLPVRDMSEAERVAVVWRGTRMGRRERQRDREREWREGEGDEGRRERQNVW